MNLIHVVLSVTLVFLAGDFHGNPSPLPRSMESVHRLDVPAHVQRGARVLNTGPRPRYMDFVCKMKVDWHSQSYTTKSYSSNCYYYEELYSDYKSSNSHDVTFRSYQACQMQRQCHLSCGYC